MASILALSAAFLFAVAAALQQKGALNLPELSLRSPVTLGRLIGETTWLMGTTALLVGSVRRDRLRRQPDRWHPPRDHPAR
jgi:hypothetical protein